MTASALRVVRTALKPLLLTGAATGVVYAGHQEDLRRRRSRSSAPALKGTGSAQESIELQESEGAHETKVIVEALDAYCSAVVGQAASAGEADADCSAREESPAIEVAAAALAGVIDAAGTTDARERALEAFDERIEQALTATVGESVCDDIKDSVESVSNEINALLEIAEDSAESVSDEIKAIIGIAEAEVTEATKHEEVEASPAIVADEKHKILAAAATMTEEFVKQVADEVAEMVGNSEIVAATPTAIDQDAPTSSEQATCLREQKVPDDHAETMLDGSAVSKSVFSGGEQEQQQLLVIGAIAVGIVASLWCGLVKPAPR